jgi:GH24 family phage-related lysozyme (muramidase)
MLEKNYAGIDGFIWWMGVVENRQDPLELGRCQVRFFGYHSDSLTDIPSANLPWAHPIHSLNSHMFTTPKETDVVFGFFADGESKQFPVMVGIVPGIQSNPKNTGTGYNDLRDLQTIRYSPKLLVNRKYNTDGSGIKLSEANTANNEVLETLRYPRDYDLGNSSISGVTRYQPMANSVISARQNNLDEGVTTANNISWDEPYPAYNPLYPYNQSIETESGHVFELDDTPRNERISMNHRSGTYWEMYPDGTKSEKITRSNYQIIMGDDHLHVMGHVYITVDSAAYIKVLGDVNLEIGNNLNGQVSKEINLTAGGAFNIKAESINMDIAQDATIVTGGSQFFTSSGDINIKTDANLLGTAGEEVDLNASGDANIQAGSGINLKGSAIVAGASIETSSISATTVNATNLNAGRTNLTGNDPQGGTVTNIQGSTSASPKSPKSAATAKSGTVTGLSAAPSPESPNDATIPPEPIPVPLQYTVSGNNKILNPTTGYAASKNQYLITNPNDPDGQPIEPTSNTPGPCNFDASTKTFIPKSKWSTVIQQSSLDLIIRYEGYAKVIGGGNVKAYPDPATKAQPYTIGYGTTSVAAGVPITLDTIIDQATATAYLKNSVQKKYLPSLINLVNVPLTQNMVDACLSLIYNLGHMPKAMANYINQGNWCAAADDFLVHNTVKGVPYGPLTTRRTKERALFLS